jgi:hypothetical protein
VPEAESGADSIFVFLSLTVRNISNHGDNFIPQNSLKIGIADNFYDAKDLEGSKDNYLTYIEPTLAGSRECYFELPRSEVGDFFTIQLADSATIRVTLSNPSATPTPAPTSPGYIPTPSTPFNPGTIDAGSIPGSS